MKSLKILHLQNISGKFDVSSLPMFPTNQALWSIFMSSCMCAIVNARKDVDDFNRVIRKVQVQVGSLKKIAIMKSTRPEELVQ